jgi:hypothetical protein
MDLRELKALELAARTRLTFANGSWLVPAQTHSGTYRVTIGSEPSGDCEDFLLHQQACQHLRAARFVCARDDGGSVPAISTDAIPHQPTYPPNWPVDNEAPQTEKHRVEQLLFELCRGLPNLKQTGPGRRWTPLADRIFACGLKVYPTVSSRRFAGDLKDAYPKG